MPDEQFAELESVLNKTIHELVFIVNFLDSGEFESAQDALITAQGNLERVSEELQSHIEED